jgi:hypothetical protein
MLAPIHECAIGFGKRAESNNDGSKVEKGRREIKPSYSNLPSFVIAGETG